MASCFRRGDRPLRLIRLATTWAIGARVGKTDEEHPLDMEEEPARPPTASSNTSLDVDRDLKDETVVENSSDDCRSECGPERS